MSASAPLPPLPPVPGVYRPAGPSIVDLLYDEHRRLDELCARLERGDGDSDYQARVLDVLVASLARHLSAEEQYLHPTVRAVLADGDRLADRELVEDVEIQRAAARLDVIRPDAPRFGAVLTEFAVRVREHVRRLDRYLLPRLADVLDEEDLVRLGNRLTIAEEAAPTRPHPATPTTPPWNKIVDPGVAVVDKVRDALAGRTTRPEDL
ncbi:MAG TPA: hemerythrin domain-containing protein [Micromonosporaceae bacterium]